jgi:hypothetical protein
MNVKIHERTGTVSLQVSLMTQFGFPGYGDRVSHLFATRKGAFRSLAQWAMVAGGYL